MTIIVMGSSTTAGAALVPVNDTVYIQLEGTTSISTDSTAIFAANATGVDLSIAGTVIGDDSGIALLSTTGSQNTITIQSTGTVISNAFPAVLNEGDNATTRNFGDITSFGSSGFSQGTGANGIFENYGQVSTNAFNGLGAIYVETFTGAVSDFTVRNFGEVSSANPAAPTINTVDATGTTSMYNSGLISSPGIAVLDGAADLVFENSGTVIGDVDMGEGTNTYRGFGGTVTGTIIGGDNDDQITIDQNGGRADGGLGDDTLTVAATLNQASGFETVRIVGTGDFAIRTDDTDTVINGNAGSNVIEARGGSDTIRAGLGDDELVGGTGKDILIGGTGADVFIYETAADSTVSDSDRIRDLKRGEDVIDLGDILTDGVFIDTGAFTGSGNSEVRYQQADTANARVEVDVDGDGSADMRIIVTGNTMLDADDFIL